MRRLISVTVLFVGSLLLLMDSALAITIDIVPQAPQVTVGDSVSVDINISGLGDAMSPAVSTFDIDLFFNNSVLALSSVFFGSQLDILGLGSVAAVDASVAGKVNMFEVSLDSATDLETLQLSDFTLVTLTFNTLVQGVSLLSLDVNALGDVNGEPLSATVAGASVTVNPTTVVPEPAAWMLLLLGLAAMVRRGKMNQHTM